MNKKIITIILIVVISILSFSCTVPVPPKDVGKYYLYDNNVKTDTWISITNTYWKDSDGNKGNILHSRGQGILLCSLNNKTSQTEFIYEGHLRNGIFSFYKVSDCVDERFVCRDFYSYKSQNEYKDSSPYLLYSIIYTTELNDENNQNIIYNRIQDFYALKGYYPFKIDSKQDLWIENNILFMNFMVKDCDEVREFSKDIIANNYETAFIIKNNADDIVLTLDDFKESIVYQLYLDTPTIYFNINKKTNSKLEALYNADPSISLKLFIYNKYVRDLPINDKSYSIIENIKITGEDIVFLYKDTTLTKMGIELSLIANQEN